MIVVVATVADGVGVADARSDGVGDAEHLAEGVIGVLGSDLAVLVDDGHHVALQVLHVVVDVDGAVRAGLVVEAVDAALRAVEKLQTFALHSQ